MSRFRTNPDHAIISAYGTVPFLTGDITAEPLIDSSTEEPLYARLSDPDARLVAARLGGRLLTLKEARILHETGIATMLTPITLWKPGADIAQRSFCVEHDRKLRAQLATLGWDGKTPLANAGKMWLEDAETGTNFGWWDGKKYIQPASPNGMDHNPKTFPPHGDRTPKDGSDDHTDYSQLTMVYWPEGVVVP